MEAMLCEFDPCRRLFVACQTHSVQKSRTNQRLQIRSMPRSKKMFGIAALQCRLAVLTYFFVYVFWSDASGASAFHYMKESNKGQGVDFEIGQMNSNKMSWSYRVIFTSFA